LKGSGHWNENVKIVICSYLRQKWIDLQCRRIHFIISSVFVIICNYPWQPHLAAAIWPYTWLYIGLLRTAVRCRFHRRNIFQL